MTGDTSRLAQARAAILAFVMVTSVLAVGFTGSAVATDATVSDGSSDSTIEAGESATIASLDYADSSDDSEQLTIGEISLTSTGATTLEPGDIDQIQLQIDGQTVATDSSISNDLDVVFGTDDAEFTTSSSSFSNTEADSDGNDELKLTDAATATIDVVVTATSSANEGDIQYDVETTAVATPESFDGDKTVTSSTVTVDNPAADGELVVDGDSGEGEYSTIDNAIGAASSGDTVLVQEYSGGTYASFTLDKQVTVTAADGVSPVVSASSEPPVTISSSAELSGLTFDGESSASTGIELGDVGSSNDVVVSDNTVQNVVDADANINTKFDGTLGGESDTNAQVRYLLDNNDIATTSPYGLEVSPTDVTVGNTETVTVDILGRDDTDPRDASLSYDIDYDGNDISSGSTSSNSFSTLVEFSNVGTYDVTVTGDDSGDSTTVGITSTFTIEGLTTQPTAPIYGDTVTVSGTVVNGAGEGVDLDADGGPQLQIYEPASGDSKGGDVASTSVTSSGAFETTVDASDAGTYVLGTSNGDFASFDVGPQEANVELTANADNAAGFEQQYTLTVNDVSGPAIPNLDGYVNVSGPFTDVTDTPSGAEEIDRDADDGVIDAIRLPTSAEDTDDTFDATPSPDADAITATLENNDGDDISDTGAETTVGLEDSRTDTSTNPDTIISPDTPDAPDVIGSDSLAVTSGDELNVQVTTREDDGSLAATNTEPVDVVIRGANGEFPDGDGDTSRLDTATVTLSGPGVDLAAEEFTSSDSTSGDGTVNAGNNNISFDVTPDEAGNVTVDISATDDDGTEYTATETIDVTGDKIVGVSPASASIDDTTSVSVDVTNADDQPVNNRIVTLTATGSAALTVFDVSEETTLTGVTTLTVDGSQGKVTADGGDASDTEIDSDLVVNGGSYVAENVTFSSPGSFDVEVARPDTGLTTAQTADAIDVQGIDAYDIQSDKTPLVAGAEETVNFTVTEDGATVTGSELDELANQFDVEQGTSSDNSIVVDGTVSTENTTGDADVDVIQADVLPVRTDVQANVSVETADQGRTGSSSVAVEAPQVTTNVTANTLTERLATSVQVDVTNPRTGEPLENANLQVSAVNGTVEVAGEEITNNEVDDEADMDATEVAADPIEDSNTTFRVLGYDGDNEDFAVELAATSDTTTGYFGTTTLDVEPMDVTVSPESIALGSEETLTVSVNDANGDAVVDQRVDISGAGVEISDAATSSTGAVNVLVNPQASGSIDVFVDSDAEVYDTDDSNNNLAPQSEDADDGALEASVDVEVNPDFGINAGSLSPSTVSDNQTVTHTLTFSVDAMSNDGNSDTFTVTLPSSVEISNVNGATITDANGDEIAISSGPSVTDANGGTNNALTFGIQPDSAFDTSTVSVEANVDVAFPDVSSETTGDVNVTVADSTAGTTGPTTVATVTIQNVEDGTTPTLPGAAGPAQDPDGDGLFEDVNGDGSADRGDVIALFQNQNADVVLNNQASFNFNGEGGIDRGDIIALFQEVTN